MFNLTLSLVASRLPVPKSFIRPVLNMLCIIFKLAKGQELLSQSELESIKNSIEMSKPRDPRISHSSKNREFTIIFVATAKDLNILPMAIRFAGKSLKSFNVKNIQVYVPDQEIELVRSSVYLPETKVEIRSENFFFSFFKAASEFEKVFPSRGSWCSQQVLKIQAVINCKTEYAVVIDADTLLLRERPWVNDCGKTLLSPSLEYHWPYYFALKEIGVDLRAPFLSFVPHHMVYDVARMQEILKKYNIESIEKLKFNLMKLRFPNEPSPFCVDFELYGQEEYFTRGSLLELMRWANIGIKPETFQKIQRWPVMIRCFSLIFNSISVHNRP